MISNTLINTTNTQTFNHSETKNIDFWYIPSNVGANIEIKVRVNGTSENGIDYFDENTKDVDVVETRELTLTFVAVDNPTNFQETAEDSINYINKTYPLKDEEINYKFNYTTIQSRGIEHSEFGLYLLLNRIHKAL